MIHKRFREGKEGKFEATFAVEGSVIEINSRWVIDMDDYSPLIPAAENGQLHIVEYLLQFEKNKRDSYLAIRGAIENGHLEVLKVLIEGEEHQLLEDRNSWFQYASAANQLQIVKYFLSKYNDIIYYYFLQ